MMTKKFEGLNKSELKKAAKMANVLNKCTDATVTGCSYNSVPDENGFVQVFCEICHDYEARAQYDVVVEVCMWDRRRSWVHNDFNQIPDYITLDNYKKRSWSIETV